MLVACVMIVNQPCDGPAIVLFASLAVVCVCVYVDNGGVVATQRTIEGSIIGPLGRTVYLNIHT